MFLADESFVFYFHQLDFYGAGLIRYYQEC